MRAPEHFAYAFSGLEVLLADFGAGGIPEEDLRREALRWMREDARGSLAMCKAAIFAMRHEAASGGLAADAEAATAVVRALGVVERAVDPPENPHSPLVPTPARAPEALKRRAPDARVFRLGKAQILAEPGGAAGWHISVSHPERFPYFEELMAACGVTGDADKRFAALIPATTASSEGHGFLVHLVEAVAGGTEGSGA
ncbi:MAG: hypothetical protein AVDCRST_MAG01-01-4519 [uncultured Rubrobacteraceae bacterium]|uniref:Uncharacterized protein n=1 Tax=uncultured Rubrobacteraceae bacterium TaxID=349277 RepID=A0A6J4QPF0_9ACTN|nr:MAG: hypothetical protein AVDCRST_MAG01-01-4519 [uncultured Rubrobacteraceae bacterium]